MPVSFPQGTIIGELYTESGTTWKWNGTGWSTVSAAQLFASATLPENPIDGNTWYDLNTGRLYFYMGGAWIQAKTAVSVDEVPGVAESIEGNSGNDGETQVIVEEYSAPTGTGLSYTLDNPNTYSTTSGDFFGHSVSVSHSYTLVGAYAEDHPDGYSSGIAYIFSNATGALLHTLDNPSAYDTVANDMFGFCLSITESYAVVGAFGEDEAEGSASGKVYVFNPATGSLLYTLDNPNAYDAAHGDLFGMSTGVCESYVIVGARSEDDADGYGSGKAYIFDAATGNLLHTLDNPNAYGTSANDQFGYKVSICESYALVSSNGEDDAGGTGSGKAYIFDTATGNLLHTLDNPNAYSTSFSDSFGYSASVCESYAIVGARLEDDADGGSSGKAYIFDPATGNLLRTLHNPNVYGTSVGDNFGGTVSITNSFAVIGAYSEDSDDGTFVGVAYIFDSSNGNLVSTLHNPNVGSAGSDYFGISVSGSSSYAVVGARGAEGGGKAYLYEVT